MSQSLFLCLNAWSTRPHQVQGHNSLSLQVFSLLVCLKNQNQLGYDNTVSFEFKDSWYCNC
jgi:hypothetical protein